jgi:hypothetical protein
MTELPMAAAGRRHAFFEADGVDQLVSIVLELATELWTLRQRVYIAERVIEGQSRPLSDLIEAYRPTSAEQAELEKMRTTMVRELFRTIEQSPNSSGPASSRGADGEAAGSASGGTRQGPIDAAG